VRILKTKPFGRAAQKVGLSDAALLAAVAAIEAGSVDAWLGGCLVKQRVARAGGGKRGGFRVIVAYRARDRLVFLHIFAKSEKGNISSKELRALQELGSLYVEFSGDRIAELVRTGTLVEVAVNG
jgi:hypothetical protein